MSKPQLFRETSLSWRGVPPLRRALPLAVQHVVAMIVGCVTPAIIVSGSAGFRPMNR